MDLQCAFIRQYACVHVTGLQYSYFSRFYKQTTTREIQQHSAKILTDTRNLLIKDVTVEGRVLFQQVRQVSSSLNQVSQAVFRAYLLVIKTLHLYLLTPPAQHQHFINLSLR